MGVINIWSLTGKDQCQLEHLQRLDSHADSAVTALTLWNRVDKGKCFTFSGLTRVIMTLFRHHCCRIWVWFAPDLFCRHRGYRSGGDIPCWMVRTSKVCVTVSSVSLQNRITGMDLASQSGLLVTTAEDGFVRVWKLSNTGRIIQHFFSKAIADCILTGVKFLDPKGSSFALASYDSSEVQVFAM